MNDNRDPRQAAIPDVHGHAKGEHKPYTEERPIPLSARMLFLWFFHACRRGYPRFMMVTDHMNYLTFEDPAAVNLVRRALKLAQAGDLYGAAETANVDVQHAKVVSDGLRRGMRYSIGAEVDNDPRSRPDAQNIVDSMKPDGMIRSVHFLTIDHPQHGAGWNWAFDNPEFAAVWDIVGTEKAWELYIAAVLDAIERLPGNILGHFYVPAVFGHWPAEETLEAYEDQVIDALAARGMALEFNTRYLYRHADDEEGIAKYAAANTRLLRKAKAKGVPITVGADAHSPRDQGNAYDAALGMLDDAEVNELVFPIAGKFARVQLRPEKSAPEPVAAPVAVAPAPAPAPAPADAEDDDATAASLPPAEEPPVADAASNAELPPAEPTKPRARTGSARTTASPAASDDRPTKARTGSRRAAGRSADAEATPEKSAPPEEPAAAPDRSDTKKPAPKAKAKAKAAVEKPPKSAAKPAVKVKVAAAAVEPKKPAVKAKSAPAKAPAKVATAKASPAKTAAKPVVKAAAKPAAAKKAPVAKKPAAKKTPAKKAPPKRR